MTSEDGVHVGRRLLGMYFLVEGLVTAPQVVAAFYIPVPGGSRTPVVVAAVVAPVLVMIGAGLVLLLGGRDRYETGSTDVDVISLKRVTLQFLGVYFFAFGLVAMARVGAAVMLYEHPWQVQTEDCAPAAVEIVAGLVLMLKPASVLQILGRHESA